MKQLMVYHQASELYRHQHAVCVDGMVIDGDNDIVAKDEDVSHEDTHVRHLIVIHGTSSILDGINEETATETSGWN